MPKNAKKSTLATGRKARTARSARRKLTEVERIRRFLLDSGFRKMTAEEMRRSPLPDFLDS
jgi:acetyl-CoA carboxylase carboxyltransferase component